jgi:excisionase family DNA binding protein
MTTRVGREPQMAPDAEREALASVEAMTSVGDSSGQVKLVGSDGTEIFIPASLRRMIHDLAHHLVRGDAVTLVPTQRHLTTQQAADLLDVSRPYLVQLLERGEIPHTRKTAHRRVRLNDLLTYMRRRDAERFDGLRELTRMSEEFGLYDDLPDRPPR